MTPVEFSDFVTEVVDSVNHLSPPNSILKLVEYNGRVYVSGLFKLHDQEGFSLTDSLIECRKRGWYPCTLQFVCDAIRAGWSKAKAEEVLAAAETDASTMFIAS